MPEKLLSSHPGRSLRSWLVTLFTPIAVVLTIGRLFLFPVFLEVEYRMPNFPDDSYGFNLNDRLYWGKIAQEYLINSEDISFISNLRFVDGSPVYNQREINHFIDVKVAIKYTLLVWKGVLAGLVILGLWALRTHWVEDYRWGLKRGGWLTIFIVGAIILFVLLGFNIFFVAFHNILFTPGTWMFEWSDTFIRLFPERFWKDLFIYIGVLSALIGLGLALGIRDKK